MVLTLSFLASIHTRGGDHKFVTVECDPVLATSREHLVYLMDVCGEVSVKQEDVIHHLDTVLHSLEDHITAKAVSITSSGEAHEAVCC